MAMQSGFIKRIRDIMRMDAGINGDAQRIEQMVWMLFLKVYDAKEDDWELNEDNYESIIPEDLRWRNWAKADSNGHAMTGDKLLNFVNNTLFPVLKGNDVKEGDTIVYEGIKVTPDTPIKKAIVKSTFEDANNYMKDGVYLRQVIDVIDEIELDDVKESHAFGFVYEEILRELQSAGSSGEFYTPRAVTEFMALISIYPYVDTENYFRDYLFYILPIVTQWGDSKNAIKGKTLNSKSIANLMIPLAPLNELQRIVAKIEELLPYVDRYAAAYEKLEQFNAKFPEDMKKSILQYAIQGKLVEQRPEEGTGEELYQQILKEKKRLIKEGKIKKEKPLTKITEDELPFDIPESWKWCRLSDVIDVRDGTHDSPKYVPVGIPLVTSKNLVNGVIDYGNVKYITQEDADKINVRSMVDDDDILFAMIGSIGNPVLVKKDREFCIKNMALFKRFANTDISMRYVYWFLFYAQYKLKKEASGGVQSFISLSRFREYLIPLPPVAEQNRIVAKLEEILPLCERLK